MLPLLLFAASVTAADKAAIMAPVDATFAALAARDGNAILAQTWGKSGATVATELPDGSHSLRQLSWEEFAAAIKPGPEAWEEKLGDTILRVDGDIAIVWGRYTFRIDGKVHHCGMDHFQLTRVEGQWKITSLTWSSRTTGCGV